MKKKCIWMIAAILSCSFTLTSCLDRADNPSTPTIPTIPTNIIEESDYSSMMDLNTYAGDDFYQYVLGTWIANNPVPTEDDDVAIGTNEDQAFKTFEALAQIIDGEKNEITSALLKSYSQETLKDDSTALMKKLEEVDAIENKDDMTKLMAQLAKQGYYCPFAIQPANYLRKVYPSLSSIEAFNLPEEAILRMGISKAEAKAILDMGAKWKAVINDKQEKWRGKHALGHYDPQAGKQLFTNFRTRGSGKSLVDAMAAELDMDLSTIAADTDYDTYFDALASYSLDEQKRLVKYGILSRDVNYLPFDPLRPLNLNDVLTLISKIISLCGGANSGLVTSMSHTYVETMIDNEAKKEVTDMFEELRGVFRNRIQNSSWMGDATKAKAIEKLDKMIFHCGWPENFHPEWEATVPKGKSFYEMACDLFAQYTDITKKLMGQTSEDAQFYCEWMDSPAYTANAFYTQANNAICLLASNMTAPIYDKKKQDFYNYAVLGATTIGHEMTHGFDSTGSQYDAIGNMTDWWDPKDKAVFEEKQQQMIDHFNRLEYMPAVYCDGKNTLGENIADLGGLEIAYETYMKKVGTSANSDYLAREFYRSFADAWRNNSTPEAMETYRKDVHAAPKLRVNGNVCLTNEWYRVFGITSGDMYLAPDKRILIW